ncbi:MAG: hypothetical protein N3A54_06770 [Patescibacteria group bacterium]|nr:hypothetical protein [Patescibacteria group bacterium]
MIYSLYNLYNEKVNASKKNFLFIFSSIFVVIFLGYVGIAFLLVLLDDSRNRSIIQERTAWLESSKHRLLSIYNEVFPLAEQLFSKTFPIIN